MIPDKFLNYIQWNGKYAGDYHQKFSNCLMFANMFRAGRRDREMEDLILDNIKATPKYKNYLEEKCILYNIHHESLSVEIVIDRLYLEDFEHLVDKFKNYGLADFSKFEYEPTLNLAQYILILLNPLCTEHIKKTCEEGIISLRNYKCG